jgi:peptidoglycan/xylan/chitin deacetylase (PgdA/CDA1 family)
MADAPIPVLMYHDVAPDAPERFRKYTVTPAAFSAQMWWLARAGYIAIGLDQLLAHREGRLALPRRPIVITFDDGFQGCAEHAAPVLQAHGFTAMFFLVAGLVGATSRWLVAERGVELPLMGWPAIRRLALAGFEFGGHSLTHPRLTQAGREVCERELRDSRALIEDRLGREVRHLAYPFGDYDDGVRGIAGRLGYRSACTVRIGLSGPEDHPLALSRVPVTGYDSLLDFACRVLTALTWRETLRAWGQRLGLRAGGITQ